MQALTNPKVRGGERPVAGLAVGLTSVALLVLTGLAACTHTGGTDGTPSAGDWSSTARPTHQRRNVLIDFKVLLAATGAPRCSIAEMTSTTSRLLIS